MSSAARCSEDAPSALSRRTCTRPTRSGCDAGGFAQQRAQSPLAPGGVGADAAQAAEREQVAEVLVGVAEHVLHQRVLGGGEHPDLGQSPPRLEQVVPAQHAGAPLREAHAAEVQLGDAMPLRLAHLRQTLLSSSTTRSGSKRSTPSNRWPRSVSVTSSHDLRGLEVGRQEHAHQAPALDLAVGRAFLGGIDEVGGLQVDRAVGQMALRRLADLVQQRLAGEGHEPQHDHRRARELVLVAAPQIAGRARTRSGADSR